MRNKFNNYSLVTSLAAATLLGIGLTTNNVKAYVQSSVNVGQKINLLKLINRNLQI